MLDDDKRHFLRTGGTPSTARKSVEILRLFGQVRNYDWGSPTAIYDLLGAETSGQPAAELWFGTHPGAPAEVGAPGGRCPAGEIVGELPFLLKVLAADRALSLQVHPDRAQARVGFDGEERSGVPLRAPHRRYLDRNHKPELIVALTPFRALAGIRDPLRTLAVAHGLGYAPLVTTFAPLGADPDNGAATVLRTLLTMSTAQAGDFTDGLVRAVAGVGSPADPDVADAAGLVLRLASAHPGDIGIAAALLLNDVTLQPGEGLFQPARMLHAYVHGVGVEIMAASDNVLRGGLTTKHIDVAELLHVLDPTPGPAPVLVPRTVRETTGATVRTWDVPVEDFRLAEVVCDGPLQTGTAWESTVVWESTVTVHRPTVILVTDGTVRVCGAGAGAARLRRGQAAIVIPRPGMSTSTGLTFTGHGRAFLAASGSGRSL